MVQNNIKIKCGEFGDVQDLRLISKPGLRPSGAQGYGIAWLWAHFN